MRQQFGAFCTNVPLGVRTLLEAPGLTTTLTAPKTALCVCPPLDKGSSTTTLSMLFNYLGQPPYIGRGPAADKQTLANKAMLARWMRSETSDRVPARKLLLTLSNSFFDYMVIHDTPHKPTLPQQRCRLSRFVTAVKRNNLCSNTYNFSDFSPCCSITFLPNVATALTENPSSKCVLFIPSYPGISVCFY